MFSESVKAKIDVKGEATPGRKNFLRSGVSIGVLYKISNEKFSLLSRKASIPIIKKGLRRAIKSYLRRWAEGKGTSGSHHNSKLERRRKLGQGRAKMEEVPL